jgi:ribosomal-protein-alanine N-acetyltransferase
MTIIDNKRLSIVKMDPSMYEDVFRNSLDEDNRRFVPAEVFESLEAAKEVVDFIIQSYESKDGPFIYAIITKEESKNIGYVQLIKINEGWEIGYHIAKKYTGRGYATEAVTLFLEYLKKYISLKEIYGVALSDNKASRRVLEKCGFKLIFEGEGPYQGKIRKIIKTIKTL